MDKLNSLVAFLATVPGRDRSCRFFQYLARALAGRLEAKGQKDGAVSYNDFSKQMGMARKVLRFGRYIGILIDSQKIFTQVVNEKASIKSIGKICKIIANLCLCVFFLADHVLFFNNISPLANKELVSKSDFVSNGAWLLECMFSFVRDSIELHLALEGSDSEKRAQEIRDLQVNMLRNVLDFFLALSFIKTDFLSKETMGKLGTLTSIIGAYQLWK